MNKALFLIPVSGLIFVMLMPMILRYSSAVQTPNTVMSPQDGDPTVNLTWYGGVVNNYFNASARRADTVNTTTTVTIAKQSTNVIFVIRPGTSGSTQQVPSTNSTPSGNGWRTNYTETGTITAGTWSFGDEWQASAISGGTVNFSYNVFKNCSGTAKQLFNVNGTTTDVSATVNINTTKFTTASQP